MRGAASALAAAALLTAACAPVGRGEVAAPPPASGYLEAGRPDRLTPPVPTPPGDWTRPDGSADGDRRLLAMLHAELRPELAIGHFDCALGTRLAGRPAPALTRLLRNLAHDVDRAAARLSDASAGSPAGPSCLRPRAGRRPAAVASAAAATAYAAALARAAPGQAAAVRESGRQIVLSGVICGTASPDQAAAGAALGEAVVRAAAAAPAFDADLADTRRELESARRTGLSHPGCAAERAAFAATPPSA